MFVRANASMPLTCQRTPFRWNLVSIVLVHVGARNRVGTHLASLETSIIVIITLPCPGAGVASGVQGGSSGAASTAQAVHELLASIPQDLLAQAAAQCGAHARALMHYETHLRSTQGGGLTPVAHKNTYYSDDEVSFLQVLHLTSARHSLLLHGTSGCHIAWYTAISYIAC